MLTPRDGLLPVKTVLAYVTCPLHSPPPRKSSWNGDPFSQGKVGSADHPLTTMRVRCSEVGQVHYLVSPRLTPLWAFILPRAPVLTVAAKPPTPFTLPLPTQAASHTPNPCNYLGLLSLPWAPHSPKGHQSHQLDLPGVHGTENMPAGRPAVAWAGKRSFPSRDLQALGFESWFCIY